GQTFYYHYNSHGDVIAMTDQQGKVVASYEYDAWGNVLKSEATGPAGDNPFGYAGYMYDKEIGMYYLIARYYQPEHGVFLSVDPDPGDADDPITQNGYTYAGNNPVMHVDPDGNWFWAVVNVVSAVVSAVKTYQSGGSFGDVVSAAAYEMVSGPLKAYKAVKKVASLVWKKPKPKKMPLKMDLQMFAHKNRVKKPFVPAEYWTRKAPYHSTPSSKVTHYRYYNGKKEKSTVIYDKFGRQKYRIDHSNHSMPKNHSVPHLHEYKYGRGYGPKGKEYRYNFWRKK
ncbi:RHS repeat domain-containing protein, partial [Priestia taiwanensis]